MEQQESVLHDPSTSKAFELATTKLLSFSDMCIELGFGMRQLNAYLHQVQLLQSGAPYSSLFLPEKKEGTRASLLIFESPSDAEGLLIEGEDVLASSNTPPGSIAVIKLHGVMSSEDDACSYGVGYQVAQLRKAYGNPQIEAVILDVNSGGGEVTAMNMMTSALSERNKPVIGFGHFVASAAYGSIAHADEVVAASPLSSFGSIGAMMAIDMRAVDFMRKHVRFFYGENAPEKNAGLRGAMADDFSHIQNEVNLYTDKFHEAVAAVRPLSGSDKEKAKTLSGAMFIASDAKKRGLIDGIGNMSYAVKRARFWAQKKQAK